MIKAHKITLNPSNKQKTYFAKASGCARFSFNWALAEWDKQYKAGGKPNEAALRRSLNAIKDTEFPWMKEVTKCAPQMAIKNLGTAFTNFFTKKSGRPKFKRKGIHDSFTLSNDHFKIEGKKIHIPKLGSVKLREELRFVGKPLWATVSLKAGIWQVSVSVEMLDLAPSSVENSAQSAVGIDLGINRLATLSNGEIFANPNALEKNLKKLKRASKALARKTKGSANRKKAKLRLAILHAKIANLRQDSLHKLTTTVVKNHSVICLEDLNVSGMTKNTRLARRLCDSSFGEIRRQIEYKAKLGGKRVLFVGRFFASSKICNSCSTINENLMLKDRTWTCFNCQSTHDRDVNAAKNILNHAVSYTVASKPREACGEESSGTFTVKSKRTKLFSMKQESSTKSNEVRFG